MVSAMRITWDLKPERKVVPAETLGHMRSSAEAMIEMRRIFIIDLTSDYPLCRSLHTDRERRMSKFLGGALFTVILLAAVGAEFGPPLVGCVVKGNISPNTGEKIYHVPGQEYYRVTRVSLTKGERWFCSEQTAQKSGWRKAYR